MERSGTYVDPLQRSLDEVWMWRSVSLNCNVEKGSVCIAVRDTKRLSRHDESDEPTCHSTRNQEIDYLQKSSGDCRTFPAQPMIPVLSL